MREPLNLSHSQIEAATHARMPRGAASRISSLETIYRILIVVGYLAITLLLVALAGRPFAYPLDDTYIHLALGRTVATSGVWGLQSTDPAAASSSPLFSVMIGAAYFLWPKRFIDGFVTVPLILNLLAGGLAIFVWARILTGVLWRDACIVVLLIGTGLCALSITGMEHVLHAALALALVSAAVGQMFDNDSSATKLVKLGALAALAVACRYESLFVIAPLMGLALTQRRLTLIAALAIGIAIPIFGFGLYWIEHGGWLLPNSLLIKGLAPAGSASVARLLRSLQTNIRSNFHRNASFLTVMWLIILVSGMAAGIALRDWNSSDPRVFFAVAAISASILQLLFATLGWLFRYEAWIVTLDATSAILLLDTLLRKHRRLFGFALVFLSVLMLQRQFLATVQSVRAVNDRRLEHLLPAAFVHLAYQNRVVMASDVGALSYYGGARVLDIFGLGNNEPVRLRMRPQGYDAASLANWADSQNVAIAILEPSFWNLVWTRGAPQWRLIALWRIPRNVVFNDRCVGFFAVSEGEDAHLSAALHDLPVPPSIDVYYAPNHLDAAATLGFIQAHCG
jgi:hypothetical protein